MTDRATTPHRCPHCRCDWDTADHMGYVNRDAPCYPLIELILTHETADRTQ